MSAQSIASANDMVCLRPRRGFYVALSIVVMLIAFVGFWPTYFGSLLSGGVDAILIIHVHAAIYVGWLVLFTTQSLLAATGHRAAHVRLGQFGIGYGILVFVAGLVVAFTMFGLRVREGQLELAQARLLGPLLDMALFTPLFGAAVYYRRRPELHKRLMIVATTSLLIAAVGRIQFLPRNVLLFLFVWLSPILLAMSYDFLKRRIVHPAYLVGIVALTARARVSPRVRGTEAWGDLTVWLSTFFV